MRIDADTRIFQPPLASAGDPARRATAGPARADDVVLDIGVPSAPPPELRDQVRNAAQVAARMALDNRELHFEKDPASNRVIVEVRDLRGELIRTIPPSSALEALNPGIWR
jgi:flagellar protein FlaG